MTDEYTDLNEYSKSEGLAAETEEQRVTEETADLNASVKATSFKSLFRHASRLDILLNCIGIISAIIGGMVTPFVFYIYGYITNGFVCYSMMSNSTYNLSIHHNTTNNSTIGKIIPSGCDGISEDTFIIQMRHYAGAFAGLGAIQLIAGYATMTTLSISANNQLFRVQCLFLKSFLRQDMAWFDNHRAGEFASRAVNDLQRFKDGIGDKIGMVTYYLSMFTGCVIMSLAMGWQLTLVVLAASPLTILTGAMSAKVQSSFAIVAMQAYAKAGNIAEEVISSIRTVFAFGGEEKEMERYEKNLISARRAGIKSGIVGGLSAGANYMVIFFIYALSFWYGIKLILLDRQKESPDYTPQNVSAILINLIFGTYYLGQISPHVEVISTARSAITFVYEVIDRIPPIDSASENGLRVKIEGNIKFNNIHFEYPSRPGMKILQGFDVEIKCGETVAFVGESGCGKSTALQLLQRYYDPLQGMVEIDGTDLRLFNIGWLREHIGVVGQEPVLFEASIYDNIRYGKEDADIGDITRAAQQANVHSFVAQLPQQYNTLVGERGAQLSGGQKQRIAIARALVRNPKILLLDEATSALDSESETLVQNALDNASHGRTTIIIAHRLTTVRNANKIVVLSKGKVNEIGTHDELMEAKGIYYDLIMRQKKDSDVDEESKETDKGTSEVNISRKNLSNISQKLQKSSCRRHSSYNSFRSKFIPEEEKIDAVANLPRPSILRLLKMNSSEWYILMFGALGSLIMGITLPSYSIIFGKMFGVMSIQDPQEATRQSERYAIMFIIIAVIVFAGRFLEVTMFSISGEILTLRLRKLVFASILRQEVAWFDDPINGTGALCSRLSGDAANVQAAARSCSDAIMQSVCAIVATIIVNLILEWRLGLVALAFIPLIVTGYFLETKALFGKSLDEMKAFEKANQKAVEAISNIKTVASLHRENDVLKGYSKEIEIPYKKSLRSAHVHGAMFGVSQCTLSFANSAVFYYGSILFHSGEIPYESVLIISELMIASSFVIGQVMSFAPNLNKALVSAARVFQLSDREPKIDSSQTGGILLDCNEEMRVEFRNVHFSYPTRSNMKVLQGLNLAIPPGKNSALVGSSGCGKSTCIQLLQRFYDSNRGQVVVNNNDIRSLNIKSLRSCIGIVSQEPVLFDKSIAENIAYGDNSRFVPMDEIVKTSVKANIHHFITTLPEGYNTNVGARGLQLSGGQKQRIAIARALLRNPKILLLDEATSALDAENEAIVQKTLEEAQKGRTCITIAHRLTTIKNSDCIFTLHKGKVAETGTHEQLLEKRGLYYKFHQT